MAPAIFSLTAFIVLNEVRRNAVVQSSEGVRGGEGGVTVESRFQKSGGSQRCAHYNQQQMPTL